MIILGVGISVALVVLVGLTVARKVDGDSTNFLVAGRSLVLPLSAAGLMGQAVDSNATLGNTDLSAEFGFWSGASLAIGLAICLILTGLFFAKPMNSMGLYTLPDYFRIRYNRGIELASSVLMSLAFCILLAGNLVAGGYLFERFLGTSYTVGVLLIVAVVLSYTISGGMFSDAYTAFLQMVVTVIGTAALFIWVATEYGISIPDGMGPFDFEQLTSSSAGAPINWATLISLGIGDIVAIDFMQRIFSAKSPKVAQRACFVGAIGTLAVGIPYSLVALSSGSILGDTPADGPVLLSILDGYAPMLLTILVLSAIVAASCSTANGVILGTGAVAVRNILGQRHETEASGRDPLLRAVRIGLFPVVGISVLLALRVPQTGILLTLAFDLLLAGVAIPFILGHFWARGTATAAAAAMVVGTSVRLVLFVLTPNVYGTENTLLHVDNGLFGTGFDGYPTFIAAGISLATYIVVTLRSPEAESPGARAAKARLGARDLASTTPSERAHVLTGTG